MSPSAATASANGASTAATVPAKGANGGGGTAEVARLPIPGPKMYNHKVETEGNERYPPATYQNYLPTWTAPDPIYPPLEPFEHRDRGHDADPTFPDLLKPGVSIKPINPTIGSTVKGIQLSRLTNAGRDQLALLAAQRKVLVFRNQDFADIPIPEALEFGRYYGPLHIHPSSATPASTYEVHIVHRGADDLTGQRFFNGRTSHVSFHTDCVTDYNPPGITFMYILDLPESGGDTIFCDHVQAYNRLSPTFQKLLHGLRVTHSPYIGNATGNTNPLCRRPGSTVTHPIVRTHPVTGEKALFLTKGSSRGIIGMKKEESDTILDFLHKHIKDGQDFQMRGKWKKGTVVVWDNRVTSHSSILDWDSGERRHLARIAPQAEVPYETPWEERK